MARRKDYYGPNNKKAKAGASLLEGFFKVAIWLVTVIFLGLIDLIKWAYSSYQAKKKNK